MNKTEVLQVFNIILIMTTSKRAIAEELHRAARRHYARRRVITKGLDDLHQADLVEMGQYADVNSGYKYMLTIIDVYSKFAWARPLKSKTGKEVCAVIRELYATSKRTPHNLQTDKGTEFYNAPFRKWAKANRVNHYSTHSIIKAGVVERFNRTLKTNMFREFTARGSYHWLSILPMLINNYNSRVHSTIGMAPRNVKDNRLLKTVYSHIKILDRGKFCVGDRVRISKHKGVFEKGFTANWSTELFTITKIQNTNPVTYLLQDYCKQPILGAFYKEELQKTLHPQTYLVERVLRKKGNKVYVKWLGFTNEHNSWINKSDIN